MDIEIMKRKQNRAAITLFSPDECYALAQGINAYENELVLSEVGPHINMMALSVRLEKLADSNLPATIAVPHKRIRKLAAGMICAFGIQESPALTLEATFAECGRDISTQLNTYVASNCSALLTVVST
jgi:hypothetical protein